MNATSLAYQKNFRIDASGALYHIIGRGINRLGIFKDKKGLDKENVRN
jgi:hypothetical protein